MARTLIPLVAVLALTGCGRLGRLFEEPVPDLETPMMQYEYASGLVDMAEPLPEIRDTSPWRNDAANPYPMSPALQYADADYRRFIRAFEHVVERFPDDQTYTPNAKIRLGEFHYLLSDFGMAVGYYHDVMRTHSEDDFLQATATITT